MAQSRASARHDVGIGTASGRPRGVGQAPARLARLRGRARRDEAHAATSARTSTTAASAQGVVVPLPQKEVVDRARRAGGGHEAVVERLGRRPLRTRSAATVTLPAGPASLTFQAELEHRGLRTRPVRLRVRRGERRLRLEVHPRLDRRRRRRATASTASSGGWVPATFDLSAYAGKTVGLRFRYTTDGAAGRTRPRALRRRHRRHRRRRDRLQRRCRGRRRRLDH